MFSAEGRRREAETFRLRRSRPIFCRRPGLSELLGGPLTDIEAHITGTVWKIEVSPGDTVDEGDTVVILESMKMEMPVEAEDSGTVKEISVEEGQAVSEGDTLVVLE
jgi:acetyl-CoA carboxylase biotin carboxyl carrier protein